jgi:hypothetical protein
MGEVAPSWITELNASSDMEDAGYEELDGDVLEIDAEERESVEA